MWMFLKDIGALLKERKGEKDEEGETGFCARC